MLKVHAYSAFKVHKRHMRSSHSHGTRSWRAIVGCRRLCRRRLFQRERRCLTLPCRSQVRQTQGPEEGVRDRIRQPVPSATRVRRATSSTLQQPPYTQNGRRRFTSQRTSWRSTVHREPARFSSNTWINLDTRGSVTVQTRTKANQRHEYCSSTRRLIRNGYIRTHAIGSSRFQ